MNVELIPGLTNVIRFPVEERVAPTVELLHQIGPDAREVLSVAEAFFLEAADASLEHDADRETAQYIAEHILPLGLEPADLTVRLQDLIDPVVERASLACREHRKLAKAAQAAHEGALSAKVNGGFWLAPLEEKADTLTRESAVLFLEAYARVLEMSGVNRAVGFARRGETWVPFDSRQDQDDWLAELDKLKLRRETEPSHV